MALYISLNTVADCIFVTYRNFNIQMMLWWQSKSLGWPKSLFGFFCNIVCKTWMNFLANQLKQKAIPLVFRVL